MAPEGSSAASARLAALGLSLSLAAYLMAQILSVGRIPAGFCNDTAEEGLRGMLLLAGHRLEIVTSVLGIPMETLWLYAVGGLVSLFGPSRFAVSLPSVLAATSCVGLVASLIRRLRPGTPFWLAIGLPVSSLWLFHYGQSGFRAASSLLFVPLVAFFAEGAEERPGNAAAAGGLAALSVYTYTSNRLVPIALALAFAFRWWRASDRRGEVVRAAIVAGASGFVVSLPIVWSFATGPAEFLVRGSYVLPLPSRRRSGTSSEACRCRSGTRMSSVSSSARRSSSTASGLP